MTSFENIKRMAHLRQEKEDDLKKNKEKIICRKIEELEDELKDKSTDEWEIDKIEESICLLKTVLFNDLDISKEKENDFRETAFKLDGKIRKLQIDKFSAESSREFVSKIRSIVLG